MSKRNFQEAFEEQDDTKNEPEFSIFDVIEGDSVELSPSVILKRLPDNRVRMGNFTISPIGLEIADNVNRDEWIAFFRVIDQIKNSVQWFYADWAAHGEKNYGYTYSDLAEMTGLKEDTLEDYAYVSRKVQKSSRLEFLSFAHHQTVAGKNDTEQIQYLQLAAVNKWNVKDFRFAIAYIEGHIGNRDIDDILVELNELIKLERPTPLSRARLSSEKLRLTVTTKAEKKEDRGEWISFAEAEADRWKQLARDLKSKK